MYLRTYNIHSFIQRALSHRLAVRRRARSPTVDRSTAPVLEFVSCRKPKILTYSPLPTFQPNIAPPFPKPMNRT